MEGVESSSLSINQYFKEEETPFGRVQYYNYKKALRERGEEGLHDQRSKGNHLKFTNEMKNFVKGLLEYNRSISSSEVQNAIKNEFGIAISNTVINNFRRENDLCWVRPKREHKPLNESGASEIAIALALGAGLIDAITDSICLYVQKKRESQGFKESALIQKDHSELRSKGKFTSEYNKLPQVRESRFKTLEEKIVDKTFASMGIFLLSRESIMRYTLRITIFLLRLNCRIQISKNILPYLHTSEPLL
jgi:transposase